MGSTLFEKIDFERGVFVYEGKEYPLRDTNFPTVDPAEPYRLTDEEQELIEKIHYSFMNSEKLKNMLRCLLYLEVCIWCAIPICFIMPLCLSTRMLSSTNISWW